MMRNNAHNDIPDTESSRNSFSNHGFSNQGFSNQGFSLVELIIVIAIMAILAAAIAPAIIRYINKARKADDIAAADSIGTTFQAAMTSDETMYTWMTTLAADLSNHSQKPPYRVIATCNAIGGYAPNQFSLVGTAYLPRELRSINTSVFKEQMAGYLGDCYAPIHFKASRYLDQWCIAVDNSGNLSIWVGGGFGSNSAWIQKSRTYDNAYYVLGNNSRVYMLWPQVDPTYQEMTHPSEAEDNWISS